MVDRWQRVVSLAFGTHQEKQTGIPPYWAAEQL